MTSNDYNIAAIRSQLISYLRPLSGHLRFNTALEMTSLLNMHYERALSIDNRDHALLIWMQSVFGNTSINVAHISLPWESYNLLEYDISPSANDLTHDFIMSFPLGFIEKYHSLSEKTNIWPASTVDKLSNLIGSAKHSIDIINPYWSVEGSNMLIKRLLDIRFDGVRIRIFTRKFDNERSTLVEQRQARGLSILIDFFCAKGALVTTLCPPKAFLSVLVHAKIIISDSSCCYVGSTNLSRGGFGDNIECGVILRGSPVLELVPWLNAFECSMEEQYLSFLHL